MTNNDDFFHGSYRRLSSSGSGKESFGEALIAGKAMGGLNSALYHVLGDPALRLATPEYFARVTSHPDSLQSLSLYHLSGVVSTTRSDPAWTSFHGVVEARVYDTEDSAAYYWPAWNNCDSISQNAFYYRVPGNAIFRGTASVETADTSILPSAFHVMFGTGNNAKISLYFYGRSDTSRSDWLTASALKSTYRLLMRFPASTIRCRRRSNCGLRYPQLRTGDIVSNTEKLYVALFYTWGINFPGAVGHKVTARIDEAQTEDLLPISITT